MAKTSTKDTETETTAVAVKPTQALVSKLDMSALEADAGKGSQNVTSDDTQTPIISILQANSPQCKKSDGKYIKGASEGMLFNNVTNEIYSGEEGITIVPCFFEKVYIEWKPARGGLVAIHPATTPLKDQVTMVPASDNPDKLIPVLPNGNVLNETNQHYVLILKEDGGFEPAVLALSSSALKASRTLNTLIKQVKRQKADGSYFNPASYINQYKLTTTPRQSGDYSWFGWTIENLGEVPDMNIYYAGRALEEAVNAGTIRVKQEEVDAGPSTATAKDDEIPY